MPSERTGQFALSEAFNLVEREEAAATDPSILARDLQAVRRRMVAGFPSKPPEDLSHDIVPRDE